MRGAIAAGIATLLVACSPDGPETTAGAGGSQAAIASSSSIATGTGGATELPSRFTVTGVVVDQNGRPVEGATVLQGGKSHEPHFTTGADGAYQIEMENYGVPTVVASKASYRSHGVEFYELPPGPIELVLHEAAAPDNSAYEYGDPGQGNDPNTNFCGHCHIQFATLFQTSKHAVATKDPLLQDLYAGVSQAHANAASCQAAGGVWRAGLVPGTSASTVNKCYLGGGVLPDLNTSCGSGLACDDPALPAASKPTAFGACADCHAPAIDGVAGGRNLHEAVGIAFDNGVHCDLCHKVKDIDLSKPPGVAGRLVLQRPSEPGKQPQFAQWRPVMFGPLLDVPNSFMGGSPQPKFKEATFCAGCHEQEQPALIAGQSLDPQRWPTGLPVHSTYSEWLAGPYSAAGTPCQHCHMPPDFDMFNSVEFSTFDNQSLTFGFARPPEDIRQHIFRSPLFHGTPRLIDGALFMSINLAVNGPTLGVDLTLANYGCGHALPTGEPMRSLVLVVLAEGAGCSVPIVPSGGMTVNDVGGGTRGVVGSDASVAGPIVSWGAGAAIAQPGDVVRAVRPTATWDDYPGIGFFANPALTPQEKGLEIHVPVGQATVVAAAAGQITLDAALAVQAGDVLYLGDALSAPSDGQSSLRLAGAAGYTFARVMVDAQSARGVPHYRAVDIASDNRIPPGDNAVTQHDFAIGSGCTSATVRAFVLYRPVPVGLAELRGWQANDYVIATAQATVPLP